MSAQLLRGEGRPPGAYWLLEVTAAVACWLTASAWRTALVRERRRVLHCATLLLQSVDAWRLLCARLVAASLAHQHPPLWTGIVAGSMGEFADIELAGFRIARRWHSEAHSALVSDACAG